MSDDKQTSTSDLIVIYLFIFLVCYFTSDKLDKLTERVKALETITKEKP